MQKGTYSVSLKSLIEHFELENCTPEIDVEKVLVTQTDVNRPALQLAGYFDYFDSSRIQMIGHVEHTYMQQKGLDYSVAMMERREVKILQSLLALFSAVKSGLKTNLLNWR